MEAVVVDMETAVAKGAEEMAEVYLGWVDAVATEAVMVESRIQARREAVGMEEEGWAEEGSARVAVEMEEAVEMVPEMEGAPPEAAVARWVAGASAELEVD